MPTELTEDQQSHVQQPYKGCLSFAIHPHHVATAEAVHATLQNLMMMYSFLDMQICSFKVGAQFCGRQGFCWIFAIMQP